MSDLGNSIGWYDATLNADRHMKLTDVLPVNAAMLLCQCDPLEESVEHALICTNEATGPIDLKALIAHFEALSRTDPKHRTLIDWWSVARGAGLKYHPWIDGYIRATGLDAPAPDTQAGQDALVVGVPTKHARKVDALAGLIEDAELAIGDGADAASISTALFQWAIDGTKPGRLLTDTTGDVLRFTNGRHNEKITESALKQRIRRYLKRQDL